VDESSPLNVLCFYGFASACSNVSGIFCGGSLPQRSKDQIARLFSFIIPYNKSGKDHTSSSPPSAPCDFFYEVITGSASHHS
jgi:hypothetical protein